MLAALQSWLSRAPFPIWAGAVCLLAALAGALAIEGYGVVWDEPQQRIIGQTALDYVTGESDELLTLGNREYGVAFELPLLLAERALGLEDSRSIYRLRHWLTHLLFIAAAFFAALLAYRMTGHRGLALFALLLFLLHPRLYAHSFFNTKDLPFLSMLMIALYLLHRAFRRDTLGAFILCGLAVGLLTNIRIIGGLMLVPAVIAMRGLDFGYEFRQPGRRRHLLLTAGAFALAAALTLYATWPWLWGDPLARFGEAVTRLANFAHPGSALFRGELVAFQSPPGDYIPTWIAITTPPATLLLALAGAAAALYRGLARPGRSLRNTPQRFEGLLLTCLILPVAAVIALDSTLYNGWRQMYFLYVPLGLLAVAGLQTLLEAAGRAGRLPGPILGGRAVPGGPAAVRGVVYGAAAVGLVTVAVQMGQLHPAQGQYFNLLVDRQTPEYLGSQYDMRYWQTWLRTGLEYLLERYPEATIRVRGTFRELRSRLILPEAQQQRLITEPAETAPADFFISNFPEYVVSGETAALFPPPLQTLQVYNNTLLNTAALDLSLADDAVAALYRQRYRSVTDGEPILRSSEFAVYRQGRTLSWAIEPCRPETLSWGPELALYPAELRHLPPHRRPHGFIDGGRTPLVRFDGQCFAQATLPKYALTRFRTSIDRFDPATGEKTGTWVGHYYPGLQRDLEAINQRRQGGATPPGDAVVWEAFPDGGRILYAKAGCTAADQAAMFFLHLTPVNASDLPDERRKYGYDNLDFRFEWRGLEMGDECLAVVPLPDYPVAAIATGQYTDAGRLWETSLPISEFNSR